MTSPAIPSGRAEGRPAPGPGAVDPPDPRPPREKERTPIAPTRASGAWTAVVVFTFLLVLLAVFVGQNTQGSGVHFLAWSGRVPTAALVLVSGAAGAVLVVAAALVRILQLRRRTAMPPGDAAPDDARSRG
jgi:uncharacterized integral membrane protein